MAVAGGPNTSESGLVLCLDAGNPRSYQSGSTTWFDLSGNGYTGSLTNGPGFSSTNAGSITFDGVNDYVNYENILNSVISGTSPKYSISTWVKFDRLVNDTGSIIINKLGDSNFGENQRQFSLVVRNLTAYSYNGFQIEYVIYNDLGAINYRFVRTSGSGITTGSVYNLCMTFDGSINTNDGLDRVNIYVNGIASAKTLSFTQGTLLNTFESGSARLSIGAQIGQNPSNIPISMISGSVYSLSFYNRALSAQEVKQNYDALKTRFQ